MADRRVQRSGVAALGSRRRSHAWHREAHHSPGWRRPHPSGWRRRPPRQRCRSRCDHASRLTRPEGRDEPAYSRGAGFHDRSCSTVQARMPRARRGASMGSTTRPSRTQLPSAQPTILRAPRSRTVAGSHKPLLARMKLRSRTHAPARLAGREVLADEIWERRLLLTPRAANKAQKCGGAGPEPAHEPFHPRGVQAPAPSS